MRINYLLLIH